MKSEPQNGSFRIEDKQTEAWGFKWEAEEVRSAGGAEAWGAPHGKVGSPLKNPQIGNLGNPAVRCIHFL